MGFQQQQQGFMYPTPPHMGVQGSGGQGGNPKVGAEYGMTPSPDSPGQWTSSEMSPQSHSDWSEGIHSPPSATQVLNLTCTRYYDEKDLVLNQTYII